MTNVPLAKPWFLGLASVRGHLVSVVDFARFCGGDATLRLPDARLVLLADRYGSRASLLVGRTLGLKNIANFTAVEKGVDSPWVRTGYVETAGAAGTWYELDLSALARDEKFLQAAR